MGEGGRKTKKPIWAVYGSDLSLRSLHALLSSVPTRDSLGATVDFDVRKFFTRAFQRFSGSDGGSGKDDIMSQAVVNTLDWWSSRGCQQSGCRCWWSAVFFSHRRPAPAGPKPPPPPYRPMPLLPSSAGGRLQSLAFVESVWTEATRILNPSSKRWASKIWAVNKIVKWWLLSQKGNGRGARVVLGCLQIKFEKRHCISTFDRIFIKLCISVKSLEKLWCCCPFHRLILQKLRVLEGDQEGSCKLCMEKS